MSFTEIAKRTGRGLTLATALVGAVSLAAAPATAYARDHGGWHGGGWHGHHGWGGGGVALGLLGGALAEGRGSPTRITVIRTTPTRTTEAATIHITATGYGY